MLIKEKLYFIAIIPPEVICEEVTGFKEDFAIRFKSSRALKVIPHITLKVPFKLATENHEQILQWFEQLPVTVPPFQQELKNFGAFNNKRNPVIYVNPIMSPSLDRLQKEVLLSFGRSYPQQGIMELEFNYKPHMTIAYRDLKPHLFKEAWKEYTTKEYAATFWVKEFHLLQHDSKKWNTISKFYLK
ncbi:MAG: 2'-5' RNA ligase family protein [Segetibacter sp.]|nr:2'-5' RNA ligase family protein [Segetibacter sp.]